MREHRNLLVLSLVTLVSSGCFDSTDPDTPTSVDSVDPCAERRAAAFRSCVDANPCIGGVDCLSVIGMCNSDANRVFAECCVNRGKTPDLDTLTCQ